MTRVKGIIQSFVLICFLISCTGDEKKFTLEGQTIVLNVDNVAHSDTLIETVIARYRGSLEGEMNRLLVYSEQVMHKGTPEGLLNNFVADLVFKTGNQLYQPEDNIPIDFCLLNYGGLRVPLPKGEITYARVFELLPFENEMVVLTLSGEHTLQLFQYLAQSSVGMPVSGVRLKIADQSPIEILIQDQSFDINRDYKILTSDYLAGGGDSMNFFLEPLKYELLGLRVRDAIITHMEAIHARGETINASLDQRVSVVN
jgi:2',3'-cyclic-nucleotide 2'-phosphodiesterase (5'-nucleotidase family)